MAFGLSLEERKRLLEKHYNKDGYRPVDRLDFRYIDSFVKLIVVLLKKFI